MQGVPGSEPNRTEVNGLTRKQRDVIPHLIGSRSIEEGCRNGKISKTTLYKWMKTENFQMELDGKRKEVISDSLERLKASVVKG